VALFAAAKPSRSYENTWDRAKTQKEKAVEISLNGLYLCRQRPEFTLSLPKGLPHTWRVQYHRPCGA
jgi:hypothetical protein